mgnify:CR=1 FL=1
MKDMPDPEPFEVKDYTNGYHLFNEDLQEKREEIYNQIQYLTNMLKQIDEVYERGQEVMSVDEVRDYLKLDKISSTMDIPKQIPKIRLGMGYVYYKKDIVNFLNSKRK